MLRSYGARLAVPLLLTPLLLATVVILVGLDIARSSPAHAVDGCRPTSSGIVCGYSGSTGVVSGSRKPAPSRTPLPPLRYLATSGGRCWYWSRYRPGFDSWNSAFDHSIILTRWRLPECGRRAASPAPVIVYDASIRAWAVFRAFPLDPPAFAVSPEPGITNLPSRLHLDQPRRFTHGETLPDGRRLEVEAWVDRVWVDWSDGTPGLGQPLSDAVGDPGSVRHTFRLKTCTPDYRATHLDGPKCHPTHDRYPITATYVWNARYRTGAAWLHLGSIDRSTSIRYDVDEVLGVLRSAAAP